MSDDKGIAMNSNDLSLRAYYDELKIAQRNLRLEICELLGISRRTFFRKMEFDNWTTAEKKLTSLHYKKPIEELFPEDELIDV